MALTVCYFSMTYDRDTMRKKLEHSCVSVLELFTHPDCVSRQESVRWIEDVLREFPDVSFREINMLEHTDRAQIVGVKFSPTWVFNGEVILVGMPQREELVALLWCKLKGRSHV